jgi:hypothetical protein
MKIKIGDIFEIKLKGDRDAFAQALAEPEYAFFEVSPLEADSNALFRIWVHKSAINEWVKIGNKKLSSDLEAEVPRFKQDPINGKLSIYKGGTETPATIEEISGLECAAVWEGKHISDRLSDHFEGKENKWLKSLQPKING